MIQKFVDRFMGEEDWIRGQFSKHPGSYYDIVKIVVQAIRSKDEHESPDPERICGIDWSDYQGTLVYVIGAAGYQPTKYWYVFVGYGSCSGCDTLQGIRDDGPYDAPPNKEQIDDYYTLALHIVQGIKEMQ